MNKGCGIELCGPGFCRPSSLCQDCQIGKGSFMWAVEQMKQGKKVRRKDHYGIWHVNKINGEICTDNGEPVLIKHVCYIEATDWEIYEENKFEGKYFIYEATSTGFVNQTQKKPCSWISHRLDDKDIEAYEKAIKRARELK